MSANGKARKLVYAAPLVLLLANLAWSQANVDEGKETAKIYVDAVLGQDTNPGTQSQPLKTVTAGANMALENNRDGIGSKVILNPGTYRESVQVYHGERNTDAPITIVAATAGTAIISGADVWTGWTASPQNDKVYTHDWPYKWGLCPVDEWDDPDHQQDIVRRREMIVVNGTPLTQVVTLSALRIGTFFVDESNSTVYIWPSNGTNIKKATVEVATRDLLFNVGRMTNFVMRGLTFQYANSCRGDVAVDIHNSDNVLIGKNYYFWNNAAGMKIYDSTHFTVRHSVAKFNGTSGTKGQKTKYDLWHDIQSRYNNWRGAQGVYYKWGESAIHFGLAHDQVASKLEASFNQTHGFHWDTDNVNDTADGLLSSQNLMDGMVMEKTQGPFTVSDSYFCNGNQFIGPNSDGITLRNSSSIVLTNDAILKNKNQIVITGEAEGIPVDNWETGQHYNLFTQNITFTNNVAEAGPGQKVFMDPTLGDASWLKFQRTLVSDYNTYWNADNTMVYTVPEPQDWTKLDFPGWQQTSAADVHSTWKNPGKREAHCQVTPDASDFWFVMDEQSGFQTVQRGTNAAFESIVIPIDFQGVVTFSADGVQNIPGASGTWSVGKVTNSGSSIYTVTTSQSTPPGKYNLTLLATSGSNTKTMSVTVIVQ
jgi:hypothetical protein